MVPIFVVWNFAFKVCTNAWIMPSLCGFFSPFFKWLAIFVFWDFAFKVCNTDWIMPVFVIFLHPFSSEGLKMKYSLKLEDYVYIF